MFTASAFWLTVGCWATLNHLRVLSRYVIQSCLRYRPQQQAWLTAGAAVFNEAADAAESVTKTVTQLAGDIGGPEDEAGIKHAFNIG